MEKFIGYVSDESGASAAEYALILALVCAAIIGALTVLGNNINTTVSEIAGSIST
jgi:pilus assembly protein Flp/PilA